ncbi:hypothetical protein LIER_10939 [Lithospermum erythrorhizon]|uniref:Reverse transcriptase Ty1/copia-type domain-containing protein n=1 Tax=Lithospermum erythrorhizon TaxID=34254 RepID=A0AAV3PNH6_LITER
MSACLPLGQDVLTQSPSYSYAPEKSIRAPSIILNHQLPMSSDSILYNSTSESSSNPSSLSVSSDTHVTPTSYTEASKSKVWVKAMSEEYDALMHNHIWDLVPPNQHHNIIGCKWVYRIKYLLDGSISRHKARLVAHGNRQQAGYSSSHLQELLAVLNSKFSMSDQEPLHYFLGVQVQRKSTGLFLNQSKYISELLKKHDCLSLKYVKTPSCIKHNWHDMNSSLLLDPTVYR